MNIELESILNLIQQNIYEYLHYFTKHRMYNGV